MIPIELYDTHAHLDDEQFTNQVPAIVQRACRAGVTRIITVGTTAESSERCVALASEFAQLSAAVGIQPNYSNEAGADDWRQITELAANEQVRAIGETGLDDYWDFAPMDVQRDLFLRHLHLSQDTDLPFIVHMRDCADAVLEVLRCAQQRGPLRGVMHSFTGNSEVAEQCVDLGLHISFAGMVTFKKSQDLRDVARQIPDDRLLIETDSPYLTPHPHRGQRPNEPTMLVHTARCLADTRQVSLTELAALTTQNAKMLFG